VSQEIRRYRVGDTQRPLLATLSYTIEGATLPTALDLTNATSVKFSLINVASGVTKINEAAATVDEAAEGKVSYNWSTADVDVAGKYVGFFTVYTSTVTDTYPVKTNDLVVLFDGDTQTAEQAYEAALLA
jgi:hypothetical protein